MRTAVGRSISDKFRRLMPDIIYICQDCGREITKSGEGPNKLRLHHEVPLEDGGSDKPDNFVCLCGACHRQRHEATTSFTPNLKYNENVARSKVIIEAKKQEAGQ